MLVSSFLFLTTFSNVLNFESIEDTRNSLLSVSDNWKKERSTTIGIPIDFSFFSILLNLCYVYSLIITRHNVKLEKNSF